VNRALYSSAMSQHPTEDALGTITCDKCGHTVKKPIKWLRSNTSMKCEGEGCEAEVPIPLSVGFKPMADKLKGMMKSWEDIKKIFKS